MKEFLIAHFFAACISGYVARRKNRSFLFWFMCGFFPLAFTIPLVLPKLCINCGKRLSKWESAKCEACPHCGMSIDEYLIELAGEAVGDVVEGSFENEEFEPEASSEEIRDALNSGDEVEMAWARDLISRMPEELAAGFETKG
jgi:hypothetical protein